MLAFNALIPKCRCLSTKIASGLNSSINLFVFTIIISTVSQLGDILISYFKRKAKIKNTGKIIPGHGGLLDRIDGMIFSFPASYLILKFPY